MQLDALEALAHRISPIGGCRFVNPGIRPDSPFSHGDHPTDGRSLGEVFADIDRPGSWIALYNVQRDPTYDRFLREVQENLQQLLGRTERIHYVRGFVFISAPPAVVPFHIDRENNFWLQIRGHKSIYVWDRHDTTVVGSATVESFIIDGGLESVRMVEGTLEKSTRFDCGPNEGVYFPSTTPHMTRSEPDWVAPGDGVSVSIGMVFYTDLTRRHARVHALNRALRRLHISPKPPGRSALLDKVKAPLGQTVVSLRKRFRGYAPPPSYF